MIASVDVYYSNQYYLYSEEWRSGLMCKVASFLALLSSEASVFFITLISIDRCISITFPFSKLQLRAKSSKCAVFVIWMIAIALAIAPTMVAGPDSDWYDLSDVCVGLPLITRPSDFTVLQNSIGNKAFAIPVPNKSKPAWYFSIAIFLGLNLVCFFTIFCCYIMIFVRVKISSKTVKRKTNADDEIKMAMKMAVIVGTDFICWFPIIVMGILSQARLVVIPLVMYIWSVVFILPINSSLNPFLYTFATLIADYKNKVSKKVSGETPKSGKRSDVKTVSASVK